LFAPNGNSFIDKNPKFVNVTAKFPKFVAEAGISDRPAQKT